MSDENEEKTWAELHSEYRDITLDRAIRAHGEDVTKLRIREPRLDDFEKIPATVFDKPMSILGVMIGLCAGIPHSSARLLCASDLAKCAEALGELGFLPSDVYALMGSATPSRATGPTGSAS